MRFWQEFSWYSTVQAWEVPNNPDSMLLEEVPEDSKVQDGGRLPCRFPSIALLREVSLRF